ncbi:MAG TPA: hypothetical protein VFL91_21225 [Thermomicrobiales bacterium]|nr:hypothetical protein [Thermomicrobiales bacterium]
MPNLVRRLVEIHRQAHAAAAEQARLRQELAGRRVPVVIEQRAVVVPVRVNRRER